MTTRRDLAVRQPGLMCVRAARRALLCSYVQVPISIVYRKDVVKLDGSDPFLLNGYGSYEISNDPVRPTRSECVCVGGGGYVLDALAGHSTMVITTW